MKTGVLMGALSIYLYIYIFHHILSHGDGDSVRHFVFAQA